MRLILIVLAGVAWWFATGTWLIGALVALLAVLVLHVADRLVR